MRISSSPAPPSARDWAAASSTRVKPSTVPRGSGMPKAASRSASPCAMRIASYSAAFSPDGRRIVTASDDKTARVWDAGSGTAARRALCAMRTRLTAPPSARTGGRIVTASDDKTARVWDAGSGTAARRAPGHEDAVNSAAFSPDGRRIVTASDDKTARVWDAGTGTAARRAACAMRTALQRRLQPGRAPHRHRFG